MRPNIHPMADVQDSCTLGPWTEVGAHTKRVEVTYGTCGFASLSS